MQNATALTQSQWQSPARTGHAVCRIRFCRNRSNDKFGHKLTGWTGKGADWIERFSKKRSQLSLSKVISEFIIFVKKCPFTSISSLSVVRREDCTSMQSSAPNQMPSSIREQPRNWKNFSRKTLIWIINHLHTFDERCCPRAFCS